MSWDSSCPIWSWTFVLPPHSSSRAHLAFMREDRIGLVFGPHPQYRWKRPHFCRAIWWIRSAVFGYCLCCPGRSSSFWIWLGTAYPNGWWHRSSQGFASCTIRTVPPCYSPCRFPHLSDSEVSFFQLQLVLIVLWFQGRFAGCPSRSVCNNAGSLFCSKTSLFYPLGSAHSLCRQTQAIFGLPNFYSLARMIQLLSRCETHFSAPETISLVGSSRPEDLDSVLPQRLTWLVISTDSTRSACHFERRSVIYWLVLARKFWWWSSQYTSISSSFGIRHF